MRLTEGMSQQSAPSRRERGARVDDADGARKRPRRSRARWLVPVGILAGIGIIGVVVLLVGQHLLSRAYAAREALDAAVPLAGTVREQLLAGDTDAAMESAARMSTLTSEAREKTDDRIWRGLEWLPYLGQNLQAVRVASVAVDDLVSHAVVPAATVELASFVPVDGRIDTAALVALSDRVEEIANAVAVVRTTIQGIDRDPLVDVVADALVRLDDAIESFESLLDPVQKTLSVLPAVLGADAPRNYLTLVQNNAESRGTGGNPAAILLINVDDGAVSIAQQASSADFRNFRPNSVAPLDPETEALYGDKIGRHVMDITMTPDFTESAAIMRAFWAESFGTPVDAVLSVDPVALSYLLAATGPVTLAEGEQLTAENAVTLLLNDVYFRHDDPLMHDLYFAAAAAVVLDAFTSSVDDPRALVDAVMRAIEEGRIMYAPDDAEQFDLIAGSRFSGTLPFSNGERTVLGAYVNDITRGKLDYYLDTEVGVGTDMCVNNEAPTFTTTITLASVLDPDEAASLPWYVSTADFFPKGVISSDVVLYGPVGSTFVSAAVDGTDLPADALPHLGRPAVKVNVINNPGSVRTVAATFVGGDDEHGPIEVRHTPMVRATPVTVDAEGCADSSQ